MGLFDDVLVNVKSAANTVSKKTNNIVDYSKLKFTASGLANEIKKKFQTLGEEVYACSKIGSDDSQTIELLIQEIDDLKAQLQATNELISVAKNKIVCPVCKAELEKESLFCNKCGSKIEADASDGSATGFDDEDVVVEDPFKEVVVMSDSDEDTNLDAEPQD